MQTLRQCFGLESTYADPHPGKKVFFKYNFCGYIFEKLSLFVFSGETPYTVPVTNKIII
jgi:hypothetical protein